MISDTVAVPDPAVVEAIEALATALAREAGELAQQALVRELAVDYKPDARGKENPRDPVSEVDHAVEALVRRRVAERFPGHGVIGEELDEPAAADADYVWVIDPIDGTANFINGFPLFAVSIGVLHHGRPLVGAVWCGATHALRPGVYHAHAGGPLHLDGVAVPARPTAVKRGLAAAPGGSASGTKQWDHRVTGSMAIEAALVAAGVFAAASFWGPRIWDVAGGVVLVRAAGREVWVRGPRGWSPFERFAAPQRLPRATRAHRASGPQPATSPTRVPSLRDWRQALIVGTAEATAALRHGDARPGPLARLARRVAARFR